MCAVEGCSRGVYNSRHMLCKTCWRKAVRPHRGRPPVKHFSKARDSFSEGHEPLASGPPLGR